MHIFVARQPIFTCNQQIYGYELLFRSSMENVFQGIDPTQATVDLLAQSFISIGWESLTRGRRAFIYFQGNFFATPEVVSSQDIPAFRLTGIQILEALSRPELDYELESSLPGIGHVGCCKTALARFDLGKSHLRAATFLLHSLPKMPAVTLAADSYFGSTIMTQV